MQVSSSNCASFGAFLNHHGDGAAIWEAGIWKMWKHVFALSLLQSAFAVFGRLSPLPGPETSSG
tara:strand:- start:161 stop:352 length:192 start_codon:yes stop_codon:yes gene_type:complete